MTIVLPDGVEFADRFQVATCKRFLLGECLYGDQCAYVHPEGELCQNFNVLITGFPRFWNASNLESFLQESNDCTLAISVSVLEPGSGRITFADSDQAQQVCTEFDGTEIEGELLSVSMETSHVKAKRKDGRHDKARDHKQGRELKIYLDELDMPQRPDVQPCVADCEVWVDLLPDEEEINDWLLQFGEVEDVVRVLSGNVGQSSHRGYVRFKEHESAARCVEMGCGKWSESERALSSQQAVREEGRPCAYPRSIISMLIGTGGEAITKLKSDIDAFSLKLRGEGLPGSEEASSSRVHFVCKGSLAALSNLQPAVERKLAEVHEEIKTKLNFTRGQEKRSRSPYRRSRALRAAWGAFDSRSATPPHWPIHWSSLPPRPGIQPGALYAPPFDPYWHLRYPGHGVPQSFSAAACPTSSASPPGSTPKPSSRRREPSGERGRRRGEHRRRREPSGERERSRGEHRRRRHRRHRHDSERGCNRSESPRQSSANPYL